MKRITNTWLESRVQTLNMLLDRPMTMFNNDASVSQQNIGHLHLDKNSDGYQLCEIVSKAGGESNWSQRLQPKDMDRVIDGIINGISLSNAHVGALLLRNEVEMTGLAPDAELYNTEANVILLHSTKDGI